MTRQRAVGVRLRRTGPVRWFDPLDYRLDVGDLVVVPGEDGPDVGRVVVSASQLFSNTVPKPLPPVLGKGDPTQVDALPGRMVRSARIRAVANDLIAERGLPARVEQVRLALDDATVVLELDRATSLPDDLLAVLADRFLARFVLASAVGAQTRDEGRT